MRDMNRLWNCRNPHQGEYVKALCVCSAGLLRSPTTAWVLSQDPWNFNTRACGMEDYALIPLDHVLLSWADVIFCMDDYQASRLKERVIEMQNPPKVICLDIPDNYGFRDPALVEIIKNQVAKHVKIDRQAIPVEEVLGDDQTR